MSVNLEPMKNDMVISDLQNILGQLKAHLEVKLIVEVQRSRQMEQGPSKISTLLSKQEDNLSAETEFSELVRVRPSCQISVPHKDERDPEHLGEFSEITDDWSRTMHESLSSGDSSPIGSTTVESHECTMSRDILQVSDDEDVEISRNIQLSNPFTLAKLAYEKRQNLQAVETKTPVIQGDSMPTLFNFSDWRTGTHRGSIEHTPYLGVSSYSVDGGRSSKVKKRAGLQERYTGTSRTKKLPGAPFKPITVTETEEIRLKQTYQLSSDDPINDDHRLTPEIQEAKQRDVRNSQNFLITTNVRYKYVTPIRSPTAESINMQGTDSGLDRNTIMFQEYANNCNLSFSTIEFIQLKLMEHDIQWELKIEDAGDWYILR